ncbi:MAG: serine hydrolase domain-containing protein [Bacteroidales bacterium]|jgi:CubicO group peptidase (beta-lactamase class C family)
MRLKIVTTIVLFLLFFLGEIAITFSFKTDSEKPFAEPGTIPFSYNISNSNSNMLQTHGIDSIFNEFMERNEIVGASMAITHGGKLVYAKGFGLSDKEIADSVTPKNLFRIASVSKLITAVAIMKLVDDEKLNVNARVFGPEGILNDSIYLNYKDKRYEQITVHHLLNHTAGWNGRKADPVFNSLYVARVMDVEPPADMPLIIEYALNKSLDYTPGKKYSYSNLGYSILGEIIEKITGMEYEEYVQFAILHPLGIYDMHIGKSFYDEKLPYEVRYYDLPGNSLIWSYNGSGDLVPVEYGGNNIELLGAAGGWVASAPELAKLMVAIDGFDSRPDILSKRSIQYMTRAKSHTRKLIGWRGTDGYGTWWRTGTLSGTTALIMRHANDINWVVLMNTTPKKRSRIHNELSRTMFRALRSVKEWPENDLFNAPSGTPESTVYAYK